MKVRLEEVTLDENIYPRIKRSEKLIEEFVDALRVGDEFPPIEVQKVKIQTEDEEVTKTILLDGWHRLEAYRRYNGQGDVEPIEEIEARFWKSEVLDYKESLIDLMVRSAELNMKHGLRLKRGEAKNHLQKMARLSEKPFKIIWGDIAKKFGVTPQWVSECVSDILAERRMSRDAFIYKLSLLGWTQQDIVHVIEEINTQSTISEIIAELKELNSTIQDDFYVKRKPIDEVIKYHHLNVPLAWAIILDGKSDLERFKLFGDSEYQDDAPRIYNVWNFANCDPRLGDDHPGRIPGQIVLNLLYYYTKQGDLVVDPMAGGGSTIDACLVMGRKCRAYDINPIRKDVVQCNLYDGFPKEAKGCDFIFLDPPYWNLQKGFYVEESVSEVSLEEWLNFMEKIIKDSYETVREGGHVALIVEAMVDERGTKEFYDLPYMCMKFFEDAGFKEVHRISVPVTTQVKSPRDVEFAKERKIILDVNRDLIVYGKV